VHQIATRALAFSTAVCVCARTRAASLFDTTQTDIARRVCVVAFGGFGNGLLLLPLTVKLLAHPAILHFWHQLFHWAEAPIKIARMTLTIKLDGNWSSFQLANNTPPLSVTGSVIAPSARIRNQRCKSNLVQN